MVPGIFLGQFPGVIFLGLLSRRAIGWGVFIGAIIGQTLVLLVKYKYIFILGDSIVFSFAPLVKVCRAGRYHSSGILLPVRC